MGRPRTPASSISRALSSFPRARSPAASESNRPWRSLETRRRATSRVVLCLTAAPVSRRCIRADGASESHAVRRPVTCSYSRAATIPRILRCIFSITAFAILRSHQFLSQTQPRYGAKVTLRWLTAAPHSLAASSSVTTCGLAISWLASRGTSIGPALAVQVLQCPRR
jgi:hypothetical protein